MSELKYYNSIETILNEVPREQWAHSRIISHTLLNCTRLKGIVRLLMHNRGVNFIHMDDVVADVATIMQMKQLSRVEDPKTVYYLIYKVAYFVISNYGKKSINTFFTEEISLSSLMNDEDDGEENLMERLSSESAVDNLTEMTNDRIDKDNARRRLTEKLAIHGWPQDVQQTRTRIGRPPKQQAQVAQI